MTSEQEQRDLAAMKERISSIRDMAFSAMRDALRATPDDLRNSGHKTQEGMLVSHFKYYQKRCDDEVTKHIKKYPD